MIKAPGRDQIERHRLTYRNGNFESDDPSFLTGGDQPGTPIYLPFASVYLTDPEKRWIDFPLIPGKTWSFRYRGSGAFFTNWVGVFPSWSHANAEVIGNLSHLIETPAGKFSVIEIRRTDQGEDRLELKYFYSPQTKSVVKLRGETPGYNAYELELIAYGNGGSIEKGLR
jgi:hypothetical protein